MFDSLYTAFEFMDPEKTKLISDRSRFAAVARAICPDHKAHEWHEIDEDGNGCVSFPEFVNWARGQGVDLPIGIVQGVDSLSDCPLPPEWSGPTSGPTLTRWNKIRDASSEAFIEIQQMIDDSYRGVWTRDRKKTGTDAIPVRYELVSALRNENHKDWTGYWLKRLQVLKHCRDEGTTWLGLGGVGGASVEPKTGPSRLSKRHRLMNDCNEWLLFHGTNERAAQEIAQGDFTMRLAGTATGTLYGRGTYFADSFTKADEYAQKGRNDICTALICRVIGGKVLYNDEVTPDSQALTDAVTKGQYDSILGDREKCRGTYREYVLFDADQIYVEYILKYKRVYS